MEQNSVSSSCRVEKSERVKEKILVQSIESGEYQQLPPGLEGERRHTEFHLLDLKTNDIQFYCAPSLLQYAVPSSMVAVDDFIYVFGGTGYRRESDSEKLKLLQPLYHKKIFFGGARLRLSFDQSNTEDWYPAPVPVENPTYPACTTLFDKIYAFGDEYLAPEVLDPAVGHWKPLSPPPHLVGCRISPYAIPDPSNSRVLMHLSPEDPSNGQPTIYAFTPEDNSSDEDWKPISVLPPDDEWSPVAAVLDNVIYFHFRKLNSVIHAFDLESGAWLKVHWETRFDDGVDMSQSRMHFDALLPLGNKTLCLAVWRPVLDPPPLSDTHVTTEIIFRRFRVEQSDATAVNLVPLPTLSFKLPATSEVYEFLPV